MSLGLKTTSNGGEFLPRIQYDARAGRFFQVDRYQDSAGNWENELTELKLPLGLVFDMENIEVGWIKLDQGVDFRMVKVGEQLPDQPSDKHRQGFRALIYNKALGIRHWNHSAKCVIAELDALHSQWEAERARHPGQMPVVRIKHTTPITAGNGTQRSTNYAPKLEIEQWIDRPEAFDGVVNDDVPPPKEEPKQTAQSAPVARETEPAAAGQEF